MAQQRIDLNVGGTRYSTTLSTLSRVPDSMLGRMFSDQWENRLSSGTEESGTGSASIVTTANTAHTTSVPEIFIDSDGTHFRYILNYLRRGESMYMPSDVSTLEELLVESNYFQLEGLSRLIKLKIRAIKNVDESGNDTGRVQDLRVGDLVRWAPDIIEGCWQSVAIAVASFHYQGSQAEAVCGFMHKTQYLPDDMEVFFLRCLSCRASTRVGEVWRYDLDSLAPIKAVMPTVLMEVTQAPARLNGNRISADCVTVNWSESMSMHVSRNALIRV